MSRARILIVDDEPGMLDVCADTLQTLPETEIVLEQRSSAAAERLAAENFNLLLADIRLPGLSGVDLLRLARQRDPNLPALMLTAYPTAESADECMKLGATDYLSKPFLPDDLRATVQRILESRRLHDENVLLRRQVERSYIHGEILGRSYVMQKVFESIQKLAQTDYDVLIVGETGTGKELVARAIHYGSRRKGGPFVPVDCGAIPDELMESEFFGHERGAFTGAQARRMGLMEFASKGTLFLDEINQLSPRLQAKLLRVLQERKLRRVGSTKEIDLDLRVVTASSRDLEDEVRKERFRMDLYHRIHVVHVNLPALRERAVDIPLLADHFLARYAKELDKKTIPISPDAMEVLTNYPWPGNVREMQNVLKQTLAMTRGPVITIEDLPDQIVARAGNTAAANGGGFFQLRERRLLAFEKEYLRNLLTQYRGDVPAAAREAKLPRGTLYRLLKKCELDPAVFRAEPVGT